MSYRLMKDNLQVTISGVWNPELFSTFTGTSFPASISNDFIWEHEGYWLGWVDDAAPIMPTQAELDAQKEEENERSRVDAYRNESDPLFFKYQRGEVEKQVWLDKVAEIKTRYS